MLSSTSKRLIISWIATLIFCAISFFISVDYHECYAAILSIWLFSIYIYSLKLFSENFSDVEKNLWLVPLIYSVILILLSVFYSLPVILLEAVDRNIGNFEAFYYCLITLTTVGYGELHPKGYSGQILSASMALVGTTHMIMFISILVSNLKKNS